MKSEISGGCFFLVWAFIIGWVLVMCIPLILAVR